MRSFAKLVAAAAVLAVAACAAPAEPVATAGSAADEDAIRAMMQNVAAAYNAMDTAAMTAMVTDDYNGLSPDGTHTMGRSAYEAQMTEDFAEERPEGFMLSLSTGYIHWHSADLATTGGTYEVAGLPEGAPNSGSWMVNVERSGADWLMSNALVATFVPEPPADAGGGE